VAQIIHETPFFWTMSTNWSSTGILSCFVPKNVWLYKLYRFGLDKVIYNRIYDYTCVILCNCTNNKRYVKNIWVRHII
jgi:hypothetical protein